VFVLAYRYRAAPPTEATFVETYGPDGPWARLFAQTPGYRGTELMRSEEEPSTYLVLDRWDTRASHAVFMATHGPAYETFDRECESLWLEERRLGAFDVLE
jgi:heme-degrading monooxygenase HmoA